MDTCSVVEVHCYVMFLHECHTLHSLAFRWRQRQKARASKKRSRRMDDPTVPPAIIPTGTISEKRRSEKDLQVLSYHVSTWHVQWLVVSKSQADIQPGNSDHHLSAVTPTQYHAKSTGILIRAISLVLLQVVLLKVLKSFLYTCCLAKKKVAIWI